MEKEITIKELANYKLAEEIHGYGLCGYSYDNNNQGVGYIYANDGFGNMETYISSKYLISMLKEDSIDLSQTISITVNANDEIIYTNFYV
jgi:hypothetical protein